MLIWFIIALVVIGVVLYKFAVPIIAKLLGQSESRVQRAIDRKKR
jgi:F0F1-type ATP synthase membrane subunit b/b'